MKKRTTEDAANEIAQALRVMTSVLVKETTHSKKRDQKLTTKQNTEPGNIVEQIF